MYRLIECALLENNVRVFKAQQPSLLVGVRRCLDVSA